MIQPSPRSFRALSLLGLGVLAFAGCEKTETVGKKTDAPAPEPAAVIVPAAFTTATAAPKSAEPNSFDEVAARLDRGGSFYFYLSTEQWLNALSQQLSSLREMAMTSSAFPVPASDRETMGKAFQLAVNLVHKSGLEEITGVGASSFALEPGVHRNTFFVHHYAGKGDGFLWSALGKAPHKLATLDLLPTDTAMASFGDLDLGQLIAVLRKEIEDSDIPEAKQGLAQVLSQFEQMAGMPLEEVLQSLSGAVGVIVTLDPAKPLEVPMGDHTEAIPTPRGAIVLQVKDDRIFKLVEKALGEEAQIVRVDEPELRMRTMVIPALPKLEVRATVAQWPGYLAISSDDALIRDMIAAQKQGKGIKSTPEFGQLSAGLPLEANGFQLTTRRFTDSWKQFQEGLLSNQPGMSPEESALMKRLLGAQNTGPSYAISAHVNNGYLAVGKSGNGAGQMIAPLLIAPVAIAAGMAMPAFAHVQEKSKSIKSLSSAKQLGIACKLYAMDNEGKYPPTLEALVPDYIPDAAIFVSPYSPGTPMGYVYSAGLNEKSPATTVLLEDKFSAKEGKRVVVYTDSRAEVLSVP